MLNNDLSVKLYTKISEDNKPREIKAWQRFWDKVQVTESGCWEWVGNVRPNGYGKFLYRDKLDGSHRAAYKMFIGDIDDGMVIDHICHNLDITCNKGDECLHRRCVNPEHLEAITHLSNVQRGRAGIAQVIKALKRTHCGKGHELTPSNTYYPPSGFKRSCRKCLRLNDLRYKAKRRAA